VIAKVQFGLNLQYPTLSPLRLRKRSADVHQRTLWHDSALSAYSPPPFPMWSAFPTSGYYGGSAPSRPDRSTADPGNQAGPVDPRQDQTVHLPPINEHGAQLSPMAPVSTPQCFPIGCRADGFDPKGCLRRLAAPSTPRNPGHPCHTRPCTQNLPAAASEYGCWRGVVAIKFHERQGMDLSAVLDMTADGASHRVAGSPPSGMSIASGVLALLRRG